MSADSMKPRYEHDCDICELIGQLGKYDIYVHTDSTQLVARYGNDGPEYLSTSFGKLNLGMDFAICYKEER